MSVMIQVRNVPDSLHKVLKARAAAAELTLTDYIQRVLEREAARPTRREFIQRLARAPRISLQPSAAELVREERDSR